MNRKVSKEEIDVLSNQNFSFISLSKENIDQYIGDMVLLYKNFNQMYKNNNYMTTLNLKDNNDIDFKTDILNEFKNIKDTFCILAADNKTKFKFAYILSYTKNTTIYMKEKSIGYIDGIYVNEQYRNLGIGNILLRKTEEYFISKNIKNLALNCKIKNNKALDFYHKIGFVDEDVTLFKKLK